MAGRSMPLGQHHIRLVPRRPNCNPLAESRWYFNQFDWGVRNARAALTGRALLVSSRIVGSDCFGGPDHARGEPLLWRFDLHVLGFSA